MNQMGTMDAETLRQIAQAIFNIATATGQVRLDALHGGAAASDPNMVQLLGANLSLLNLSSSFAVQAASVTLGDVAGAVRVIQGATAQAEATLRTLHNVDRALRVAAAVIVLGTAVFTADPEQIAEAAQGVLAAAQG